MNVRELIEHLQKFAKELPVVDYEGSEIGIVRTNYSDYDVAGDNYEGDPYVVIL